MSVLYPYLITTASSLAPFPTATFASQPQTPPLPLPSTSQCAPSSRQRTRSATFGYVLQSLAGSLSRWGLLTPTAPLPPLHSCCLHNHRTLPFAATAVTRWAPSLTSLLQHASTECTWWTRPTNPLVWSASATLSPSLWRSQQTLRRHMASAVALASSNDDALKCPCKHLQLRPNEPS